MRDILKRFIKKFFNLLGFAISRQVRHGFYEPYFFNKVDLILDVGANTGQFAIELRTMGYKKKIISFEPLSEAHESLVRAAQRDSDWEIYRRCALGAISATTLIYESQNSVSSSLRVMKEAHLAAAPNSKITGSEEVQVIPLKDIYQSLGGIGQVVALKIDTQGFELDVLLGLGKFVSQVKLVQLELSLVELYDKQALHLELLEFLDSNGFQVWSIKPGFTDPATGRLLQYDAVLVNMRCK